MRTPAGAAASFHVSIDDQAPLTIMVTEAGREALVQRLQDRSHVEYISLFDALAVRFELRRPLARQAPPSRPQQAPLEPILTEAAAPSIRYGYGDPCVVRVGPSNYRLVVTSNDAPDAFPILSSTDLKGWRLTGFVFPEGHTPEWALTEPGVADFWAPELHRVGAEWWVCFCARARDRTMVIGLARASDPDEPFSPDPEPLLVGDVIDPHIVQDADGAAWLVWKKDDNGLWPGLLADLLHERPSLSLTLFSDLQDQRTAALAVTLWPWIRGLPPMEQFFVLQPLIEAASRDISGFAQRLDSLSHQGSPELNARIRRIAAALRTRVYAQRLSADGRSLEGERHLILQNDLPWEGHLIEGVWITPWRGRYYLLYAGNDFSTGYYGVGAAVADHPAGPYEKHDEVFLSSTERWWGPGHPSVAELDDGSLRLFLHAYKAGAVGYKTFRALLSASIELADGAISIRPSSQDRSEG